MSFKKIDDYKKRDELMKDHIKLQNEVKEQLLSERLGKEYIINEREKIFKPITDKQEEENKILKEQKQLFENMIKGRSENPLYLKEQDESSLKNLPTKYLGNKDTDISYGIRKNEDKLKMGNKEIKLFYNDIIVDDEKFEGTEGLWELITEKNANLLEKNYINGKYSLEDIENYKKLLNKTKALYKEDGRIHGGKSKKLKFAKSIAKVVNPDSLPKVEKVSNSLPTAERTSGPLLKVEGSGVKTVIIPCNPNDLIKRLDLLLSSKIAGNNGLENELNAVLKRLYNKK